MMDIHCSFVNVPFGRSGYATVHYPLSISVLLYIRCSTCTLVNVYVDLLVFTRIAGTS